MKAKEQLSCGIICCRLGSRGIEVLLVRKSHTYAYTQFIYGRYKADRTDEMIALFSKMTLDEQIDILSLDFKQIWYRVWRGPIKNISSYFASKAKFETAFLLDGGRRLLALIAKASHSELIWEAPKGKKTSKSETNIQCAMREFTEETAVARNGYTMLPSREHKITYIDCGVRYTCIYFVALSTVVAPVCIKTAYQLSEVSRIRWFSLDELRLIKTGPQTRELLRRAVNYTKKYRSGRS